MKKRINDILSGIVHAASGRNIVEAGMVDKVSVADGRVSVELVFPGGRDPLAKSLQRRVGEALEHALPGTVVEVTIREGVRHEAKKQQPADGMGGVKRIVAVSSTKGGVGKSTVAANLAVALASMGHRVGVLDADIHGPSQPMMFGVEGYKPVAIDDSEDALMVPASAHGVEVMSIGFFIDKGDALVWRGPMVAGALKQLINRTAWGELDFLIIDMPPGTGDVQLTVLQSLHIDGAVIVSTPQRVALADTERGIGMFRLPAVSVPILGMIENMSWFTPAELPDNRYYIFGRGGAAELAKREGLQLLGEIPVIQSVMDGGESGVPGMVASTEARGYYVGIAEKIVDKLS